MWFKINKNEILPTFTNIYPPVLPNCWHQPPFRFHQAPPKRTKSRTLWFPTLAWPTLRRPPPGNLVPGVHHDFLWFIDGFLLVLHGCKFYHMLIFMICWNNETISCGFYPRINHPQLRFKFVIKKTPIWDFSNDFQMLGWWDGGQIGFTTLVCIYIYLYRYSMIWITIATIMIMIDKIVLSHLVPFRTQTLQLKTRKFLDDVQCSF